MRLTRRSLRHEGRENRLHMAFRRPGVSCLLKQQFQGAPMSVAAHRTAEALRSVA